MHQYFGDIIEKLGEPLWFDDCGYPRYCKFDPDEVSNIYAKEVALLEIACQNCGHRFKVAIHHEGYNRKYERFSWMENENYKNLGYGDPPNIRCCGSGPSMTSDEIKVLEFWSQNMLDWIRHPEFEVNLENYKNYSE